MESPTSRTLAADMPIAPTRLTPPPFPAADATSAPASVGRRVLIVDDIAANRLLLQLYLERIGYLTEIASSGAETVRLAATNAFDAILMDVQMPGLDGVETTRQIRDVENPNRHTLIVAVTACLDRRVRERCLNAGMDAYFAKPVDLRKFGPLLAQMIDQHPA